MKLDVVKICAGLIIILALLMSSSMATETTWRFSGFELYRYDINYTDHNASNLRNINGVNFTDSLVEAPTYIISTDGSTIYVKNGNTGVVDYSGTNASTVLNDVIAASSSGLIVIKKGVYVITSQTGVIISNKNNLSIHGEVGAILRQQYAGIPTQLIYITGCNDVDVSSIILDQNRSDPIQSVSGSLGMQWIARVGNSTDVKIRDISFINGFEEGLVVGGNVSRLEVSNCYFNNFGEHPIYISGANTTNNLVFDNLYIYNWAKIYRGYMIKITNVNNIRIIDSYAESNQDGAGFPGGIANSFVVANVQNMKVRNFNLTGSGHGNQSGVSVARSDHIYFDRYQQINHGGLGFTDQNVETNYYEMSNCFFTDLRATGELPTVLRDSIFIDPRQITLTNSVDDYIIIRNTDFIREDVTHDYSLINVQSTNVLFDNVRFFNWTYRILFNHDGPKSHNVTLRDCYISGGVTSTALTFGYNTIIEGCRWGDDTSTGTYGINSATGTDVILRDNYFSPDLLYPITTPKIIMKDNYNKNPYDFGNNATAPTPFGAGDEYYNDTDNLKYVYDGSAWDVLTNNEYFAEANIYNNAVDTVIETANTPIALRQITTGSVNGWTFDAGSTGGITAYANGGGGKVTVSDAAHGLSNEDIITIRGTTNYNGVFAVSDVSTDAFNITDTWVADDGASDWDQGASLTAGSNSAGYYSAYWQMSMGPDAGMTVKWMIYINTVAQTQTTAERKYAINDFGCCGSSGVLDISAGDVVWLSVQSDDTANILNKHGNLNLHHVC